MRRIICIIYLFFQCTWGILQTAAGLSVFLRYRKAEHSFYHGCIRTKWDRPGGVSLGLFIFVAKEADADWFNRMSVHEYGHAIQSLILGPFYLPVAGAVSFAWCNLPYFCRMREERHLPYTYCHLEKWASMLGERILKEKAV